MNTPTPLLLWQHSAKTAFALTAILGVVFTPSLAHATKKVYAPYVEQGELEIDLRSGYDIDDNGDTNGAFKQKIGVGYGVNDYWFVEFYSVIKKDGADSSDAQLTALEWENIFRLTEQGEYFVDVGVLTEVQYNTSGGPDKAELKLLLAKDTGKFSHLLNINSEREFGEDSADETGFGLGWSSRYRYSPKFEPGFEFYSDFGSLSNGSGFEQEKHQIGPVVYGKLGKFKYNVGYLVGASDAAPDGMVKALFEYELYF